MMAAMSSRWRILARRSASALAGLRIGLGVVAFLAPVRLARGWVGAEAVGANARVLARAMGGRDLALGLGAVAALRGLDGCGAGGSAVRGGTAGVARRWLLAGGLADAGDLAATLVAWRKLPQRGRWVALGLAGASVIASAALAQLVDRA